MSLIINPFWYYHFYLLRIGWDGGRKKLHLTLEFFRELMLTLFWFR